jgi:3-hydroxyacyl-[acyl-carrier-protein] dehydratase
MKIAAVLFTTLSCVGAFTSGPILSRHHSSSISSLCGKKDADDDNEKVDAEFVGAKDISALTKDVTTQYTSVEVDSILPHRYPFALIDKVIEIENGKRAVGVKAVSKNEDFFQGHFPGQPVMPGVLQLEALAQLTGIILNTADGIEEGTIGLFGSANDVKWKKPVVPGDLLVMEVEVTKFNKKYGIIKSKGKGYTDGDLAVEVGEMTMILMKPEKK